MVAGLLLFIAISVVLIRRRLQAPGGRSDSSRAIYLANIGIVAVGRLNVADLRALATDLQYYVDVHIGTIIAFVLGFTLLAGSAPDAHRDGKPRRRCSGSLCRRQRPSPWSSRRRSPRTRCS